jgi:hypothetical protein
MPGRLGGPERRAQTVPEIVAPAVLNRVLLVLLLEPQLERRPGRDVALALDRAILTPSIPVLLSCRRMA